MFSYIAVHFQVTVDWPEKSCFNVLLLCMIIMHLIPHKIHYEVWQ